MFFTSELLSRRDSGFGLLWLAATLGARSSFKKLPKRDVIGADITQLCGLIAEPAEPLALRLSSNLMVGVARVYKVKHDIFLGDVNACFSSLKKAVRDLHALSAPSAHLQMGQPIVRSDAVTVQLDPAMSLGLNIDDFLGDWQDIMEAQEEDGSDDEYGRPRKKSKYQDKKPLLHAEIGRATLHTLDENLEQMMSGSFDVSSLSDLHKEQEPFSSQIDVGFTFGDSEDFGLGDIGDELARELGDGWASVSTQPKPSMRMEQQSRIYEDHPDVSMDFGQAGDSSTPTLSNARTGQISPNKKMNFDILSADMSPQLSAPRSHMPRTPTPPWAGELGGSGNVLAQVTVDRSTSIDDVKQGPRKTKRVRVQLDERTELTDEELKIARAQYVEGQEALRREIEEKRLEKEGARLISQMLYGVPPILKAPTLVDFWTDNFKVLVETRSGALHIKTTGVPPAKRRRLSESPGRVEDILGRKKIYETHVTGMGFPDDLDGHQEPREFDAVPQRSSEEPGQARYASIGSFPTGSAFDLGRHIDIGSGSQKSSLFPWDNAGRSSSAADVPFDIGSDRITFEHDDIRLKNMSVGRTSGRESSLAPSQQNSGPGTLGFSPRPFEKSGFQINDSFEFDVPEGSPRQGNLREGEPDLITLERNSFNFLEYVKMQLQTVQEPSEGLAFDNVAPRKTCTSHVAAAAFYHCLVLATKGVLRVNQVGTYGEIIIKLT